jgi:hypothetical protein
MTGRTPDDEVMREYREMSVKCYSPPSLNLNLSMAPGCPNTSMIMALHSWWAVIETTSKQIYDQVLKGNSEPWNNGSRTFYQSVFRCKDAVQNIPCPCPEVRESLLEIGVP